MHANGSRHRLIAIGFPPWRTEGLGVFRRPSVLVSMPQAVVGIASMRNAPSFTESAPTR